MLQAMISSMKKIFLVVMLACVSATCVLADDVRKPDLLIADNSFFDPTRKQKVEEPYHFHVEYRIEAGFVQGWQHSKNLSFPDMYLNGARVGATFTFVLPLHFGLETGLLYTILTGDYQQHFRSQSEENTQVEVIRHNVLSHRLTIPLRCFYTVPLWRKLNLFFYTGPQLYIGLVEKDHIETDLSDATREWVIAQNIPVESYDRMSDELLRASIQWGLGGGIEWDRYRLEAGYDFGLNNLVRHPRTPGQHMWEWGWNISVSFRL